MDAFILLPKKESTFTPANVAFNRWTVFFSFTFKNLEYVEAQSPTCKIQLFQVDVTSNNIFSFIVAFIILCLKLCSEIIQWIESFYCSEECDPFHWSWHVLLNRCQNNNNNDLVQLLQRNILHSETLTVYFSKPFVYLYASLLSVFHGLRWHIITSVGT